MDYYVERPKEPIETPQAIAEKKSVELTETALLHLNETRKWSKFIAVFSIVMAILLALLATVLLLGGTKGTVPGAGMIGVTYLFAAILTFVPMWFLIRFSNLTKKGVAGKSNSDMEEAFKYLKFYYIATGVLVIISIIFVIAFMIAGLTMGFVSSIMQSQNI
jgi:hypothetical protein